MRRWIALAAVALLATACGDDGDEAVDPRAVEVCETMNDGLPEAAVVECLDEFQALNGDMREAWIEMWSEP